MDKKIIKEQIRDLLLSDDFKKLEKMNYGYNLFNILKLEYKETAHSDMLAYLLNPCENHYLKESMINELFKHLSKKDANYINLMLLNYSDLEVYREYTIDNGRRLDILLISKCNKVVILIENKIWSGEGDNQLEDYKKYIDDKYNNYSRIFLYLTPEKERKKEYKSYIHITYNNIYSMLENVLKEHQMTTAIWTFLKQYKDMIRRDIMGEVDKEIAELCRKLYVEHKEALDKIMQFGNTIYYLTEVINDLLQSEPYNKGEVILKKYGHIVYLPYCKNETREKLQCGFQEDREYIIVSILVKIDNENIKIILQGSGKNKNNTDEQNKNYDKLKNIFENIYDKQITSYGWYILNESDFKINNITLKEEFINEVKKVLDNKLEKPINMFNEIISLFEKNI